MASQQNDMLMSEQVGYGKLMKWKNGQNVKLTK